MESKLGIALIAMVIVVTAAMYGISQSQHATAKATSAEACICYDPAVCREIQIPQDRQLDKDGKVYLLFCSHGDVVKTEANRGK